MNFSKLLILLLPQTHWVTSEKNSLYDILSQKGVISLS